MQLGLKEMPSSGASEVGCLLKVDSLPLDFAQPLLANYPAMKIGQNAAVDSYIGALTDKSIEMIRAEPHCRDWVITAPPFIAAPAAANLLCWKTFKRLRSCLPASHRLELLDLHYASRESDVQDEADFKLRYEYSNNSLDQRIKERGRLRDNIAEHESALVGRGIIVINDIRVTGTQQIFMQKSFNAIAVKILKWLYLIEIESQLGLEQPGIEHQINTSRLQSLDEFITELSDSEHRFTARCISRIFAYSMDDFLAVLHALEVDKVRDLARLVKGERRFSGDYFRDKYNYLRSLVKPKGLSGSQEGK